MTGLVTKHLPLVAAAPDGIRCLRTLILDVAIQGLLTAKAGSDCADEFTQSPAGETEPFRLPPHWRWSTVGDECELENGDRSSNYPNKSCLVPSGVPFINAGHLNAGGIDLVEMTFISRDRFDMLRSGKVQRGDLLYCLRGSLGKTALVDGIEEGAIASSLVIVRPGSSVIPRYLLVYFNTSLVAKQISRYDNGTAQPNLAAGSLRKFALPVPSPEEQHRIVAKVDELMALCDRLEADQADAEAAHAQLVQALLDSLTQATDAADFRASWQRLSEHFHTLFTTEASIDALKQTVLQLAVMGKLALQDSGDESTAILLERIADEFAVRNQSNVSKQSRRYAEVDPAEQYVDPPSSWVWTRLGALALGSGAGWSPSCEARPRAHEEWGVLKVSAVSWGEFRPEENKALPANLQARPEHEVLAGDFLVSRANTAELVARSVVVESAPPRLMLSDKIVRVTLTAHCNRRYVNLVNSSPFARSYYSVLAGGTSSSMKNVTREQILNLPVPLPPLAEQHRIVAKVDELMALCDQLKAQLAEARTLHSRLVDALVAQAVS